MRSVVAPFLLLVLSGVYWPAGVCAAAETRGETIYRQMCASCHGDNGQGVMDQYGQPLVGDASLVELARIIDKTMPEGEPEKCTGEDAKAVAEYMYDRFYSPEAQVRNTPARVELSRLTVRQYQESVADLIGSFRGGFEQTKEQGLKAEYFTGRRYRKEDRKVERIDPVVKFDFGEGNPVPDSEINPEDFAIRWSGSIIVPETGEYEFIVKTANGVQLWVNNDRRELINGRVRSGNEVEHRERITLLGGRRYRLRLEMFKAQNAKEKQAAIELWWRMPHRTEELIAARYLVPGWSPESFVPTTPFPPDDRSVGYERGTAISKEWDQATTNGALEVAAYVTEKLPDLSGTKPDAPNRAERLKEFCGKFVERAFRRPLTDEQKTLFVESQFQGSDDLELSVKKVVLLTLKSPRFLYREIAGEPNDAWNVASRLSATLWDSIPDRQLWDAAQQGRLKTPEQIRQQAERMAKDARCNAKLRVFLLQWLRLDHLNDIAKDSALYPEFTPQLVSDLRSSLDLFLEEILASDAPSLQQLFLEDKVWLNGRLAAFYGVDLPAEAEFQKVAMDDGRRRGVISHPLLMAGFAYTSTSSPIHRGVFLSRSVLGRSLKAPPIAVSPTPSDLHPDLTTRQRVALQTEPEACRTCHNMINPLGFSLENFDAVGKLRTEEKGKPIDVSGGYLTRRGEQRDFDGSQALAAFLASSDETHAAFTRQLFAYLVKQAWPAWGPETLNRLTGEFQKKDFNIRQLMVDIAVTASTVPK